MAESASSNAVEFRPVAVVRTPFKEKFGIPRQSRLVDEAIGRLELLPPYDRPEAFKDLEGFSHVWLIWLAHEATGNDDSPVLTVRPPRLGGNRKIGVFASRSPFRPNSVGLSVVKLEAVEAGARPPALVLRGVDLLDGTPVLDIKPYLPYADVITGATGGFAPFAPDKVFDVEFSRDADEFLKKRSDGPHLRKLIAGMLELDPRPAYRMEESAQYAFRVEDLDVKWRVDGGLITVDRIEA